MHGLAITGNNMLYYEKQFTLLQIMSQKRTCRIHVPFDRGNKVTPHPQQTTSIYEALSRETNKSAPLFFFVRLTRVMPSSC